MQFILKALIDRWLLDIFAIFVLHLKGIRNIKHYFTHYFETLINYVNNSTIEYNGNFRNIHFLIHNFKEAIHVHAK